MSALLGFTDRPDSQHLAWLCQRAKRYEPPLVSEYIGWGAIGGVHRNDLLPMPCAPEALTVATVQQLPHALGREFLVENPSSYASSGAEEMPASTLVAEPVRRRGGGLLPDVNQIYVNSANYGYHAHDYLRRISEAACVGVPDPPAWISIPAKSACALADRQP